MWKCFNPQKDLTSIQKTLGAKSTSSCMASACFKQKNWTNQAQSVASSVFDISFSHSSAKVGNIWKQTWEEKQWKTLIYIKATSSTAETCGTCKTEENDFNAIFRPRSSLTKKDAMKSLNRMPLMHNATNSWRFVSGSNARSPGKLTMEYCITVSLSSIEHTYSHAPCSLARFYYANELNGNLRCSIVMSKISTQLDWVWWHKCNTSSDRSRILSSLTKCFVVAWLINQQPPNIPPQKQRFDRGVR